MMTIDHTQALKGGAATTRDELLAEIRRGKLQSTGHINYGASKGGGYPFRHTTVPRLSIIDRTQLQPARLWLVDGRQVADFEAAVDTLLIPAVLTDSEAAMLERIPAEWTEVSALRRTLAGISEAEDGVMITQADPRAAVIEVMHWLNAKGMLEYRSDPQSQSRVPQVRRRAE